ncbi:alpha-L-rhamnosidase-related protein, partial [Streptomyces shenzhenensis]|uniref:alpha-L-rhamnosidase-related protein n=1 Tax=Streptomyces shenzhenensis TaxID=943815 RepID=UPI002867E044
TTETPDEPPHPGRAAARPTAAPHEEFLWDTGFHFGEWLEPGVAPDLDPTRDHGDVATAYLHRSADLLARTAALLGRPDDAAHYRRIAEGARAAWRAEYLLTTPGTEAVTVPDTQATLVRALAFGLVPDRLRTRAADRLAALVRSAGTHLTTGFLSTGLLLPVLADHGHLDLAYALLQQPSAPSWRAMIDRGATTIWEDWHGTDEQGRPKMSYNHYSKGAVVSFLHQYTAGIRLPATPDAAAAGYRRFVIAPCPGGGLTSASARHDALHGTITSHWQLTGDHLTLTVQVPPGTEAEVRLPRTEPTPAPPGTHTYTVPWPPQD